MIIDLNKLKRSGKDTDSFSFDYLTETELSNLPEVKVLLPIKVEGNVSLTGKHSALVECDITFTLEGECTRCLALTKREYLVMADEECDEQTSIYPVVNDKIVLDKLVEDAILMNMPVNFLCKEDCKGICAGCGVDLNTQECKCKNE